MRNLISVIVCTYNRCEILKDTLDSLLNQECDKNFDYEIIVTDNNSKDTTKEVAEDYKKRFNGRLKYLFEPKQGKSYALNRAIKEAKGEIIAFIDDDCMAEKRWLAKIWHKFNEDNAVEVILGDVMWSDDKKMFVKKSIVRGNGGNMGLKNRTLREIGEFDTNLGAGSIGCSGEDSDFVYRAKKKNKNIVFCTEIIVVHKQRMNVKEKLRYIYRDYKGLMIFWLKYVIKERDVLALKNIYWQISGTLSDLFNEIKNRNRENVKLKIFQFSGMLVGLVKGTFIWSIIAPSKILCQK